MAKITRADLARRKRIELYKKGIIYGFLALTLLPIFTSLFLLYKVDRLEQRIDFVMRAREDAQLQTKVDTSAHKKYASGEVLTEASKSVLGNVDASTGSLNNTEVSAEKKTEQQLEQEADTTEKVLAKRVYLTFDDGPSIYTGQILDVLAANDVKATFFVIGKDEQYYEFYKRIVEEGHTIGMHSYTHKYDEFYASLDSFDKELTDLNDLIYETTGTHSNLFRFPGGSSNNVAPLPIEEYIAYLNEHNINYYDWNSLSGDAVTSGLSADQLVANIMNDVRKNQDSIVLMHDLQTAHTTVESLQLLIDTLKNEGYEILPIDADTPMIQHVSCNLDEE